MSDPSADTDNSESRPWRFGTRILVAYGVFVVLLFGVVIVQGALAPDRQSGALASPAPADWTAAAVFMDEVTVHAYSYGCHARAGGRETAPITGPWATARAAYFDPERRGVRTAYGILMATAFPCTPQPAPTPTPTMTSIDLNELRDDDS